MGDIKLFRLAKDTVAELQVASAAIEKSLQILIERHLEAFLGVRFLSSEYSTGKTHRGRIDSLGLDENGCPVIIEYKRALNENVINQGLFYLDWLLDHKAELILLVQSKLGQESAKSVEWSNPRLVCIAGDFTKYDEHAVQQINRSIELIRYRRYGDDLLLFELVNATAATGATGGAVSTPSGAVKSPSKTPLEHLASASAQLTDVFEALKAYLHALGDDVQMNPLSYYIAFKRIKNFACLEIHPQANKLLCYVKVNPDAVTLEKAFTRDVRKIGHFGTGDLEITMVSEEDLEKAKPYILQSYEAS